MSIFVVTTQYSQTASTSENDVLHVSDTKQDAIDFAINFFIDNHPEEGNDKFEDVAETMSIETGDYSIDIYDAADIEGFEEGMSQDDGFFVFENSRASNVSRRKLVFETN